MIFVINKKQAKRGEKHFPLFISALTPSMTQSLWGTFPNCLRSSKILKEFQKTLVLSYKYPKSLRERERERGF